ncbi:MAG: hypothetical protein NC089_03270 [Bacteroides sp.]|nr:hypothetical protein [Bacteroides sp.]MCM1549954.1 hypothetical protein [Clostridium sp.]
MRVKPASEDYKKHHPKWGCVIICLLLLPVAILLAGLRIVWCVIDRVTSVAEL